jgi:periplasmic divalent cation tolerance protein
MDELVDVTVTAADAEWLANLTRDLVKDKLVACGNIIPTIRSVYAWQGKVEDEPEALVVLHTRRANVPAVIERISQEHPYDTPQILVLPIAAANAAYRDWLITSTSS